MELVQCLTVDVMLKYFHMIPCLLDQQVWQASHSTRKLTAQMLFHTYAHMSMSRVEQTAQ